jgi:hypothetical protein
MLPSLIGHSPDLKRLVEDGYEMEVLSGHLLLHHVPYVSADRKVKFGILVSELSLVGEATTRPPTHVAMFVGDMPCDVNGNRLEQIFHSAKHRDLGGGLEIDFSFSSKPPEGYSDYYHKMTTYEAIISGTAQHLDPLATAQTFSVLEPVEEDSVFLYADTASSRAGIGAETDKLKVGPLGSSAWVERVLTFSTSWRRLRCLRSTFSIATSWASTTPFVPPALLQSKS